MLTDSYNDASVIRLLNTILAGAMDKGASEVHIEQAECNVSVQYLADGVMNKLLEPPQQAAAQVVPRIKLMAKLNIAEERLSQESNISLRVMDRPVDVRVTTLPSNQGERVIMHLLYQQA